MHVVYLSGTFDESPRSLLAAVNPLSVAGLEVRHSPRHSPVRPRGEGGPAELQQRGLHVRHLGKVSDRRAVQGAAERRLQRLVVVLPVEGGAPRGHGGAPDPLDFIVRQKVGDPLFSEEIQKVVDPSGQQLLQSQAVPLVVDLLKVQLVGLDLSCAQPQR